MTIKKITLVLLFASSLLSCIKTPEVTEDVPSTAEEVETAFADAWGESSILSMKPQDFIYQTTEQTVETDPRPLFILSEGMTVSKKEETAQSYDYTFLYQFSTKERNKEESPLATRETTLSLKKATATATSSAEKAVLAERKRDIVTPMAQIKPMAKDYQMIFGFSRIMSLAESCYPDEEISKICREDLGADSCEIKCANVKTTELMVPVPEQVKLQENCGGFANCMWRTKMVSFDWIISLHKNGATDEKRINYLAMMSSDLPFFARVTKYCSRQVVTLDSGQTLLISSCTNLENYKPGPALPTP